MRNLSPGSFLPAAVFLVFLTLKLAEVGAVASWSWWWVTAPLWIPVAIVLGVIALGTALHGLSHLWRLIFWTKAEREQARAAERARRALDELVRGLR